MSRRWMLLTGCLLLCLPSLAGAQLYQHILQITNYEHSVDGTEPLVQEYVGGLFPPPLQGSAAIGLALNQQYGSLCEEASITRTECIFQAEQARGAVSRITALRTLARDLQILASTYEVGFDGLSGREHPIAESMPTITRLWESGADAMTNPYPQAELRKERLEPEVLENALEQVRQALTRAPNNPDEASALAWRYRHGVLQEEQRSGPCTQPDLDGTELQYVRHRWCASEADVEQALKDIHALLPEEYDPPLKPNEVVIFQDIPIADGLTLWIRSDDVGLVPTLPTEPVHLGLQGPDEAILGGTYPDPPEEPGETEGICSHPIGKIGYLCQPAEPALCPSISEEERDQNSGFALLTCYPQNMAHPLRYTPRGSDVCSPGGWRLPDERTEQEMAADTPQRDEDLVPGPCSTCAIDFVCSAECNPTGVLQPKNPETGVVEICIGEQTRLPTQYHILGALAQAQQVCNAAAGEVVPPETPGECCTHYFYPAQIVCKALEEDGLLEGLDITIEECAGAFSSRTCSQFFGEESVCYINPPERDIAEEIYSTIQQNETGQRVSCPEAVTNLDARSLQIRASMPRACNPECVSRFENTIGNNLCYLGQCVEQSLEEHRIIPGRLPTGVGDEAFPWDACVVDDPKREVTEFTIPSVEQRPLPRYRVASIIQSLDTLFCESRGFPRLTPPVLCAFDSRRGTGLALGSALDTATSITTQQTTQRQRGLDRSLTIGNIGSRLAKSLSEQTLGGTLDAFAGLLDTASQMLEHIGSIRFTDTTCPRTNMSCEDIAPSWSSSDLNP